MTYIRSASFIRSQIDLARAGVTLWSRRKDLTSAVDKFQQ
jgi:hypothetical protein